MGRRNSGDVVHAIPSHPGKGSFGVVRKVQCRQTKAMRVMKIVDKQRLRQQLLMTGCHILRRSS